MPQQIDPTIRQAIADAERAGVVARREAVPEEAARVRRRNGLRDVMASLPEHVRKATRGDLVQRMRGTELFKAVDRWEWGNGNLVMNGPTGLGKTSAAGYLVRKLIGAGIAHGGDAYERALLIRWQRARLLVLDDLKVIPQAELEPIDRVLSHRYDAGYPTITTTGLSSAELLKVYGDALCRRLLECQGKRGAWVNVRAPEPEGSGKR
jgi:DNA replication protein DnaC